MPTPKDMTTLPDFSRYPSLAAAVQAQLGVWPKHLTYLAQRFGGDDDGFLQRTDDVARLALLLAGADLPRFCADYQWMCSNFMAEDLYFRRNGRYRLQTFADANQEVYSNPAYMSRYVNGILISQLFWRNHAQALDLFRTAFLPLLPDQFDHLEVGPGHGLFLSYAALDPRRKAVTGWDVSASSIHATRAALACFGIEGPVDLTIQDILQAPPEPNRFDSAIISEVLEHLEQPDIALRTLFTSLRAGGSVFINIPINSPAPDHIYLWTTPEAVADLVTDAGFAIDAFHLLPMTGFTLERAQKTGAGLSCVLFARKPQS